MSCQSIYCDRICADVCQFWRSERNKPDGDIRPLPGLNNGSDVGNDAEREGGVALP